MAEAFDPYHKWLGIPPRDQPPNHYRLLGLELFESDAEVIDAAANRQMSYIQSCADGPHLAISQQLLNEVSAARLCLLDRKRKAAYDGELKEELAAARRDEETSPPPPPPPAASQLDAPPVATVSPAEFSGEFVADSAGEIVVTDRAPEAEAAPSEYRPPNRQARQMYLVAGAAGLLVIAALVLVLAMGTDPADNPSQPGDPRQEHRGGGPTADPTEMILPRDLDGVVLDNVAQHSVAFGSWHLRATPGHKFVGRNYLVDNGAGDGKSRFVFGFPRQIKPGYYEVRISYVSGTSMANNVRVSVIDADGKAKLVSVNQQQPPEVDGLFHSLGIYKLNHSVRCVEIANAGAKGLVVADAVQFIGSEPPPPEKKPKSKKKKKKK